MRDEDPPWPRTNGRCRNPYTSRCELNGQTSGSSTIPAFDRVGVRVRDVAEHRVVVRQHLEVGLVETRYTPLLGGGIERWRMPVTRFACVLLARDLEHEMEARAHQTEGDQLLAGDHLQAAS